MEKYTLFMPKHVQSLKGDHEEHGKFLGPQPQA